MSYGVCFALWRDRNPSADGRIAPEDDVSHPPILPILLIDVKNAFRILRIGI